LQKNAWQNYFRNERLNAYVTLEFKGKVVEATNDKTENANASISANFETFQKLLSASS